MKTSHIRAMGLCALLASTALTTPAFAQSANGPPPAFKNVDENGVDLATGKFNFAITEGAIGDGDHALSLERYWTGDGAFKDNWSGGAYSITSGGVTTHYIDFGDISDVFVYNGSIFVSQQNVGTKLEIYGDGYIYTTADGTRINYRGLSDLGYPLKGDACPVGAVNCSIPTLVTRPDGATFTLNWDISERCTIPKFNCETGLTTGFFRFSGVTNAQGQSFYITYATNDPGTFYTPVAAWFQKTGASFYNSVISCGSTCPSVTYATANGVTTITDNIGRQWRFTVTSGQLVAIKRPGSGTDTTNITYSGGIPSAITKDGVTTNYARVVNGSTATTTITNALAGQKLVTADLAIGRITSARDEANRTTSYQYDASGRLTRVTMPEGNNAQYTYDARGNVTQTKTVAKAGSGQADIYTYASYDATCTYIVKCNKPNSTTDALGKVTDYTYDSTHGGLLTVTLPAPSVGAVRPQTRYGYTLTSGKYRLTSVSACQTTTSCAGTADEVKTTLTYDGNANVTAATSGAGNGSLTATSTMTYDGAGNLLTVDGPLAGTADTSRARYDAGRRLIGTISPDPDGAGAMKMRARRFTYNADGQVTKIETGTVNSQSDADWAAFVVIDTSNITYGTSGSSMAREIKRTAEAGGTIYAVAQASYDAMGRADCTAQRMNPAVFASLPASACTLGTEGSYGKDRIGRVVYDAAGNIIQQISGYGTTDQAIDATTTFTNNNQLATVKDAENNLTTYEYDGHDRLVKTRFPSPTKGAGTSSASDYEQLTYDGGSRITQRRLRDGNLINYGYDDLSRLTLKDMPGGPYGESDISYTYDNLSRLTSAHAANGLIVDYGYDALSRLISDSSSNGLRTMQYDAAGRMTRLTWSDGFYATYDYLVTGEVSTIKENGSTALATFGYDAQGRRSSLTYGNGAVTSYSYDPLSRLGSLTHDITGTAHDITLGFGYNPASQIISNTRSNDLYAWAGHGTGSTASATNGLNQFTSVGGASITHDARGNIASDGASSYVYTHDNQLSGVNSGTHAIEYDPAGRLEQLTSVTMNLRFNSLDGGIITEERDGNNGNAILRRYVYGPGVDEPLVWYEGAGTSDKRFLHADERGSVIAVTNAAGAVIGINSYDEYGKGAATNIGRFQYTGQIRGHEFAGLAGITFYKARWYDPKLGRFLQTDPIGYGGGPNMYNYVGSDPINNADPSGMMMTCTGSIIPRSSCGGDAGLSCTGNCGSFYGDNSGGFYTYKDGKEVYVSDSKATRIVREAGGYWQDRPDGSAYWVRVGSDFTVFSFSFSNFPNMMLASTGSFPRNDISIGEWFFNQLRDSAVYQYQTGKEYLKKCVEGVDSVSIGETAKDGAKGAARSGAIGGYRSGPAGAVRGAIVGGTLDAARSVVKQACSNGNAG